MGFSNLLNKKTLYKFLKLLSKKPGEVNTYFHHVTRMCVKKNVKERIVIWIKLNGKTFKQFLKMNPKLEKKTRFHILGCILISLVEFRNSKFVTLNPLMLNCCTNYESFFVKNRSKLESQIQTVLNTPK